jgi:DNA-binding CsgD family transcriptional regulator
MISPQIIAEAARLLLTRELSQRQIAARLGISRGTVLAISRQRRPLNLHRVVHAAHASSKQQRRYAERVTLHAAQLPERCPECRNLVLLPCQACASRRQQLRFTG